MRAVVLQQYAVSLDGFSCADDSEFQSFVFALDDPALDEAFIDLLGRASTHVMGRVAYEGMSRHFPGLAGPVADAMNAVPKVVFSKSLASADWPDSRVARGDLAEEIGALKSEGDGEILAHGGYRLAQSLVRQGLVDVIRLFVFPVALGHGTSIFAGVDRLTPYHLASSTPFPSGVVLQVLSRDRPLD